MSQMKEFVWPDKVPSFHDIHTNGIERHRGLWLRVNQRVVDACIFDGGINPTTEKNRRALSAIAMRVLDGFRLDNGERWDESAKQWRAAERPCTEDRSNDR